MTFGSTVFTAAASWSLEISATAWVANAVAAAMRHEILVADMEALP
jgi:hypothetical protein